MTKKHYVKIFIPDKSLGIFCVEDNPQNSSVIENEKAVEINVPLNWAMACVKGAGYKVYKEM